MRNPVCSFKVRSVFLAEIVGKMLKPVYLYLPSERDWVASGFGKVSRCQEVPDGVEAPGQGKIDISLWLRIGKYLDDKTYPVHIPPKNSIKQGLL